MSIKNMHAPRTCPAWYGVKVTPGQGVINWWTETGMIDEIDMDKSRGDIRASVDELLKRT
jgi:hypothetical protein